MRKQNLSIQRQILLLNLVNAEWRKTQNEYVDLLITNLSKNPLLSDFNNIKITLEKIKKELVGFTYEVLTKGKITSVLDYDLKNLPQSPSKIRVIIEDGKEFRTGIVELEKKLTNEEDTYIFILSKNNELSLEGSNLPPYKMEEGANRIKLLRYLSKKKNFTTTKNLADKLNLNTIVVRKTIGEIRTEVSKKLKVPPKSIIKNQSGLGYKVGNIKLI